jgi:hypothetical protein
VETIEKLLVRVMNLLAEQFKGQLILKGGMLLRLLGSPRETADLDYVWIRTQKRNHFAEKIKATLKQLDGINIENISSNSRGVFLDGIDLNSKNKFKIEINIEIDRQRPRKISAAEGAKLLKSRLESLNEEQIQQELSTWLKPERLLGLRQGMLMSVNRVCRSIEGMDHVSL